MAQIRNSINLTDNMSGKLNTINRSLQRTVSQMQRMQRATLSTSNAMGKYNARLKTTNGLMNRGASSAGRLQSSMGRMKSGGFNLVNLASGLYILEKAFNLVKNISTAADESKAAVARIGLYNESPYSNEQIYRGVYDVAQNTRSDLGATSDLMNRILVSRTMRGPGAPERALGVTETINKAMIAGGSTSEESKRALLQLSQGLSSGTLQGDELRSIREQAPYLIDTIARGLGKIDDKFKDLGIGDMKALGAQGELTSERLIKAFEAMADEVNADFEKMPRTFGQNMTIIGNATKYWLYLMSQAGGALDTINQKATEIADYLNSSRGFDTLEKIAGAINVIVDAIIGAANLIGDFIGSVLGGIDGVLGALSILAAVGTGVAIAFAAAWAVAHWPILAVIGAALLLTNVLIQMGTTASTIINYIAGLFAWFFTYLYNICAFVYNQVGSLFYDLYVLISDPVIGIADLVIDCVGAMIEVIGQLANAVSGVLKLIGVDLGSGFVKWTQNFRGKAKSWVRDQLGGSGTPKAFETIKYKDISKAVDKGLGAGLKIDAKLNNIQSRLGSLGTQTSGFNNKSQGVNVNGGNLDSVGKIKGGVDISDEDIKLLKDIAAREFLLNLTTQTPTVNVKFGDVRETANVKEIMETIENMLEEAAATSLVYG